MYNWWYYQQCWFNCVYGRRERCVLDDKMPHCANCDCFLNQLESISFRSLPPILQQLLQESWGNMIFIDKNTQLSPLEFQTLSQFLNDNFTYPLNKYIDFDFSGDSEVYCTIYEGIYSVLYNLED